MPPSDNPIKYRFGTVLQHPTLRNVIWMVVAPTDNSFGMMAMRVKDEFGGIIKKQGLVTGINVDPRAGWIVLDPGPDA